MTTFAATTTYAHRHYDLYARRCIETFGQFWHGVELLAYEDADLNRCSWWLAGFKTRHAGRPTRDWRRDAVRFAHKVAAIELALAECRASRADVLVWIDADCLTHDTVTPEWLDGLMGEADFAFLARDRKHSETGFMMIRNNGAGNRLVAMLVNLYASDALFDLDEWHDAFAIDSVRRRLESAGLLTTRSLSGPASASNHPLVNGPLGARLDHLKGPRKAAGRSHDKDLIVPRSEAYWSPHAVTL